MRRTAPAALTLTAATTLLTACGSTPAEEQKTPAEEQKVRAAPTEPAHTTCTGPRADETAAPVEPAVAHVDTLAAQRFAHVYTGLRVDHETLTLDIYRIPDTAFDRSVCRGIPANLTVRLHDTRTPRTDLDALVTRISEEIPRWKGEFDLRTVAATEEGRVEVGVDKPKAAEPLLRKAYGGLVDATYEEEAQLRRS
ncbi:hypothetical protein H9Y04_39820 [Streptomyces sp. TRM66268-LWL]|uniref:Lipoprotein n=1 Tax=Streptomyces polyasparticus TaxID=2767826 RepID=A0ABR7SVQ4_9ACTN|nr:hypothetical protein [Streptomyces polyasparticus]MBC9718692.1 hypothetical protein [Streptomyces polyasparticus]